MPKKIGNTAFCSIPKKLKYLFWFATTWQGGHECSVNTKEFFSRRIYMKMEFSSPRRKMLLFLTTNMAAVTSRANHAVLNKNQSCQLSRIIQETPDFGPYLPVSRLESDISRIIAKVAIFCRLNFPTIKFQIFCVVWATVNMECFLIDPGMPLCNVAKYELFMCDLCRLESTSIFGTNDVICRVTWCHLSFLPQSLRILNIWWRGGLTALKNCNWNFKGLVCFPLNNMCMHN